MRSLRIILITIFLYFVPCAVSSQTQSSSNRYVTIKPNRGALLTLTKDSSFMFQYFGHIFEDTAAGRYQKRGDTLFFLYHYNNYDSTLAEYKMRNEQPPIDLMLTASRIILRPHMMLKRRNRLFYIDID